jgi:cytochrome c biogenesis protein CcdA
MGVLVSVFGAAVGPFFGYFKPAAGLLFLLLGTLLYTRSFYLGPFSTALGKIYMEQKEGGVLAFFLFGLAYGATALGCTLPIFLVLVIYPLFTGDVILGFLAFAAYSMAKALLMVGVTYLVAYSKDALVGTLAVSTGRIKRFSGAVIAAIGIYLISGGM